MTEAELLQHIRDLARMYHWRFYHPYDSRRSDPGFPDCTLVKAGRLLFFELKTDRGRLSAAQASWLGELAKVPGAAVAWIIRPDDLQLVADILSGKVWPA